MADHFRDKKELLKAIDHYQTVLKIALKNKRAYEKLALVYVEIGENKKAMDIFSRALVANEKFASIYQEIRDVLKQNNDKESLAQLYKLASQVKLKDGDYYFQLAYDYDDLGDYNAAIFTYQKALKFKPGCVNGYTNMGIAQGKLGDYDSALSSFQKALELNPDDAEACTNVGFARYKKGDLAFALTSYKNALKINPNFITAKVNLAELHLTLEEIDEAMEMDQQVLKEKNLPPEQILAMKSIVISSLFFQGNFSQAFLELQQLIVDYMSLTDDLRSNWDYSPTRECITKTQAIEDSNKKLILKMIDLLSASKKESTPILDELEKMVQNYKR